MRLHVRLAVSHGFDPHQQLLVQRFQQIQQGALRVKPHGIDQPLHGVIKNFRPHVFLLERKPAVSRFRGDLPVAQQSRPAVLHNDGPERFKARFADHPFGGKEEIALPEAFDLHRAVRLGVDGQKHARFFFRLLRNPAHQDEGVAIGIGVHRAGAQSVAGERQRIIVRAFIRQPGPGGAGVDGVHDLAKELVHAADCAGLFCGGNKSKPAAGVRRLAERSASGLMKAEGQAQFPAKVGAQIIGIIRTIGLHDQRGFPLAIIFVHSQMIVEEIVLRPAGDFVQAGPRGAFLRPVKQSLDPCRVEQFRLTAPSAIGLLFYDTVLNRVQDDRPGADGLAAHEKGKGIVAFSAGLEFRHAPERRPAALAGAHRVHLARRTLEINVHVL
ncbi:MAG: hypothetical protein BWY83_01324 [bacterium ADurb.Bin478]|nr:MAG: hypothetical protein BWY83_01324 [bacterium ADurb.Bin478]